MKKAYQAGFRDGIEFMIKLSKDEKVIKVFKDGDIFREWLFRYREDPEL